MMECTVTKVDDNEVVIANDINYGKMKWFSIDGLLCCSAYLEDLGYEPAPMFEGDVFYDAAIEFRDWSSAPSVYAKNKSEVLAVAKELSKHHGQITVLICARYVAWFKDGKQLGRVARLDEYYTNLTEEFEEASDLTPYADDVE